MEGLFPGGRLCHDGQSISIPDSCFPEKHQASQISSRLRTGLVIDALLFPSWVWAALTGRQAFLACITRPTKENEQRIALPT